MKVLHVIPSISEIDGGPSQAIFPMCVSLREQGIDLVLVTTDAGLDYADDLARETLITHKGVPLILFPKQVGASFKYSRPFSQWLQENVAVYDLVHIHAVFNHACVAAARACRKQGVPYIVRPLGTLDPWSMKQKSFRKRLFWHSGFESMLKNAAAIHYTAAGEQEAVEESLNLKNGFVAPLGVEIPNEISLAAGPTLNDALPLIEGHPYVLVLSRLHPKKCLETLIESFLAATRPSGLSHWRLLIAGDGETDYVDRLKQIAARDGSDSVVFAGWLDGAQKDVALRNASLVALTSRQENFGLCIVEAMAHGVPVMVSPQVNLAPEIEESRSGWVVPIDVEKLKDTLTEAMTDEGDRKVRGRAGRQLATHRFNWDRIARQLADVYSSIVEERAAIAGSTLRTDAHVQSVAGTFRQ